MKKYLLSLAAAFACASMSAKVELPVTFSIPEDGTVAAWSWNSSSSLNDGHWEANPDSVWVQTYDYADASAYDYITLEFSEATVGARFMVQHTDWAESNRYSTEFVAGQTLVAVPTSDLGTGAAAIQSFILQPTAAGILKDAKLSYVSEAEYQEMFAADAATEKKTVKVEDVTVESIGDWTQVGPWFGEVGLDALYKTIVVELTCSANVSVNIQSWSDGEVHRFMVKETAEPVIVALPISADGVNGLGQVALSNKNYTSFAIDSVSGLPVPVAGECSAVIKSIYYTSNEVVSTFVEAEEASAPTILFEGLTATQSEYLCDALAGFSLTSVDSDAKQAVDANNATFGIVPLDEENDTIAEGAIKFTSRLKTGGKSGSKNKLTLHVPADGVVSIAVRSASGSATDRKLVLTQDGEELFNDVILDAMGVTVENEEGKKTAYPLITVPVKAGDVEITYPVGALNFYGFIYGTGYYVAPEPEEDPEEEDPTPDTPVIDGEEIIIWEGEVTSDAWSGQGLLTDGCPELINAGAQVGDVLRLYFTCDGELNLNVIGGHWEKDEAENIIVLGHAYSNPNTLDHIDIVMDEQVYTILTTQQWWGSGLMIQAGSATTCTKICLIKASEEGIESIEAAPVATGAIFNLAGQRASKGLVIMNGKVVYIK